MNDKITRQEAIRELTLALMYLTRFNDKEGRPFFKLSWKGYDLNTINMLDEEDLIRNLDNKSRYAYLLPKGLSEAKDILDRFGISDTDLYERFEFRMIKKEEADEVASIEQICFPPNEACSYEHMHQRVEAAADIFMVAVDRENEKIAGFVNGIATDEKDFRDEFFTDASLHNKDGKHIMICGLSVLPEYRKQGLGRELIFNYCLKEWEKGRERLILTCEDNKVKMYKKFGFTDQGQANSFWGGVKWHQMEIVL